VPVPAGAEVAVAVPFGKHAPSWLRLATPSPKERVRRANQTYEYLTLVESGRVNGTNTRRTLFRLGEGTALRETGELDRIIAALQAHAERCYVDLDELEAEQAPMIGTMAAVRHLWDEVGASAMTAYREPHN
jgi:hypothetical protein